MAVVASALPACGGGGDSDADTPHSFTVTVDTTQIGESYNAYLMGHNVQWTALGDHLVDDNGDPDPSMDAALVAVAPTVIRFPGGEHADVYHWASGIGDQALRTENMHPQTGEYESSVFGTAEYLDLCRRTSALPVITVNVPTGTAAEAAAWVKAINITGMTASTGEALPKVEFWEIGNEPYLDSSTLPDLALSAEEYATKAIEIIQAMKAEDASIAVGIPLSTDSRNGTRMVRELSWTVTVLTLLSRAGVGIDFITTHNAYLPLAYDKLSDRTATYWATMAASRAVAQDLDALQALVTDNWSTGLPIALTEYNALFSLDTGASDEWTGSPLGALYVADLLRTLATRSDVACANLWSLSDNGRFGAIHADGWLRPTGQVMALMSALMRGQRLTAQTSATTVNTVSAGLVPAVSGLPVMETLASTATADSVQTVYVLLIQKHLEREGNGTVELAGWNGSANVKATLRRLHTSTPFASDDVQTLFTSDSQDVSVTDTGSALRLAVTLPTCCVALLEVSRSVG